MAKLSGCPSVTAIELQTQKYFFTFQVIHGFLITSLSYAAISSIQKIAQNPSSVTTLLSSQIPAASNFYYGYIGLQGLSFAPGALAQISALILGKILGKLLDNTPRKKYTRFASLADYGWGTVYPVISLLAVIAIVYSCIAPLVMGFSTIGLYLFYFAYRYDLLYCSNTTIDTQGRAYVLGLQHLTVGCYVLLVCLIGLFAIACGTSQLSVGPLVLIIFFTVMIALYHASLNSAVAPLLEYLPKNLEAEQEDLLAQDRAQMGDYGNGSNEKDKDPNSPNGHQRGESVDTAEEGLTVSDDAAPAVMQKGGLKYTIAKYLKPHKYCDFATLSKLVPGGGEITTYNPEVEETAYLHPAITAQAPLLWIPHDDLGVSRQEVEHTSRVINITDEGAWLNEKNKLVWDEDSGRPPIFEESITY